MNHYNELLQGENREYLRQNPFFKGLSDDEIADFLRYADPDYYELEPEQIVTVQPGDKRKIGIVLTGEVKVQTVDYSGDKSVLRVQRGNGTLGALQYVADQYNMLYEVVAGIEGGRLLALDPDKVLIADESLVRVQHQILVNVMMTQRRLFFELSDHIVCLTQKTLRNKVLRYLQIKSEAAHAYEFDIPLSRDELAAYLAVDRASLSRALGELRREGVIDFRKNHFKILDTKHFRY